MKLPPAATSVARRFIQTAVARKNLARPTDSSPTRSSRVSLSQSWQTGNIAVVPYPVADVKYAPMKIDFSYPKEAQVEVALLPKAGAKVKGQLFLMDLVKRDGKWLVNSWVAALEPAGPERLEQQRRRRLAAARGRRYSITVVEAPVVAAVSPPALLALSAAWRGRRHRDRGAIASEHRAVERTRRSSTSRRGSTRAAADEADQAGPATSSSAASRFIMTAVARKHLD